MNSRLEASVTLHHRFSLVPKTTSLAFLCTSILVYFLACLLTISRIQSDTFIRIHIVQSWFFPTKFDPSSIKVFVHGSDGIGWSIDQDRRHILHCLERIGCQASSSSLKSHIIHNTWWNMLLKSYKMRWISRIHPCVLVTASNFIDPDNPHFHLQKELDTISRLATGWIAPSRKQQRILESLGLRSYLLPFMVSEKTFFPPPPSFQRMDLIKKYGIPQEKVENRLVIGSFQRDSLGSNLNEPKWQKGPDILADILEYQPKDRFLLLLAGPRRHYLMNECESRGIPFHYIGNRTQDDDLNQNNLCPLQQ